MKSITTKRVMAAAMFCLSLSAVATAQTQPNPPINITSKPSGVTVILEGENTVAGVTPTTFSQKLSGFYKIVAHREGYETYHASVILSGRDATSIDIKMSPKTRIKAGVRSMLIPGWGQFYTDSKTKGVLLVAGTLAAGVTAGLLHLDFDKKRDEFTEFQTLFNSIRSVETRELMLAEYYRLNKRAYDAEKSRKLGAAVLAGIWAYNVLDAVLFFPDYGLSISGTSLSLEPGSNLDGFKVVGRVSF